MNVLMCANFFSFFVFRGAFFVFVYETKNETQHTKNESKQAWLSENQIEHRNEQNHHAIGEIIFNRFQAVCFDRNQLFVKEYDK